MTSFGRIICSEAASFAVIVALVLLSRTWRKVTGTRAPTEEKLLRPPGESLQRRIAALDERLNISAAVLIGGPALFSFQTQFLPLTTFIALLVGVIAVCAVPLGIVASQRRNYALGYSGERAVGETLNQLLRDGCHVFHDFPGGSNWNVDHIIVAPSGVYAVETKTRRKRRAPKGRLAHEVIFDGKTLRFPRSTGTRELEQVRCNAVSLGRELSSSTGEPVKVKPILTFPGWLVTLQGKADVHVLNPKQIRSVVLARGESQLSSAQMQRIVHQLDQKCRDVEF